LNQRLHGVFMADQIPVETGNGSHQRVAYDLTMRIARVEEQGDEKIPQNREYFLRLYMQCLKATYFNSQIDSIMELSKKK
jgi:hypothetical protein